MGYSSRITCAFVDGGVIKKNPSTIGGTYAFCFVDAPDNRIFEKSGVVPCPAGRSITNNVMELVAICLALEHLPVDWEGAIWSDSEVALNRVFPRPSKAAWMPQNLYDRLVAARARLGSVFGKHLPGIKVKKQLDAGIGSYHQYWCDRAARAAGLAYYEQNYGKTLLGLDRR